MYTYTIIGPTFLIGTSLSEPHTSVYCGTISLYVRLYARTYRICKYVYLDHTAYGPNIRLLCTRAYNLKVVSMANRQQDSNEELAEERTVEDAYAIAARVCGRRTEARRQWERERHRQGRVAGQVGFTKFSFRGGDACRGREMEQSSQLIA